MAATGVAPAIVSVHPSRPSCAARRGPGKSASCGRRPAPAEPLLQALNEESDLAPADETVGDNEPYDGALEGDTIDAIATGARTRQMR